MKCLISHWLLRRHYATVAQKRRHVTTNEGRTQLLQGGAGYAVRIRPTALRTFHERRLNVLWRPYGAGVMLVEVVWR